VILFSILFDIFLHLFKIGTSKGVELGGTHAIVQNNERTFIDIALKFFTERRKKNFIWPLFENVF
jgi:hypothetical protein